MTVVLLVLGGWFLAGLLIALVFEALLKDRR